MYNVVAAKDSYHIRHFLFLPKPPQFVVVEWLTLADTVQQVVAAESATKHVNNLTGLLGLVIKNRIACLLAWSCSSCEEGRRNLEPMEHGDGVYTKIFL
jgi:hypothetical protein